MAVVKRGKKGVFYMLFMLEGKRVYRSTGKYTKKEALLVESAEKHKMIKEANLPPHEKNARTLLQDVADQVYETRWKHGKDSQRSYMRACNLIKIIGNIPIGEINQDKVEDLVKTLDKAKAASGTINRYLTSLKMMMKYKKQDTDYIKLRKERKGRIRVISPEEEQQAVNLLRHTIHGKRRSFYPEVADLAEVLVDSGLRLSELLDLRYDDVNFETNLLSIWINKGDRPRSLPMTKRVRRIMEARKKEGVEKPFTLKPYQAENAWRWVKREMKLEKDKEFLIHALRHTTATRLVNRGIDLYVVKEWLGHSTIQVTEKYSHLAPHKLEEALSVLE